MNGAFAVGPFAVPHSLLLVLVLAVGSGLVAKRIGKTLGVDIEPALWRTLLVGIVVARLGFVYEFRTAYLEAPLGILDIRDGGWSPVAGFLGAWLYGLSRTRRDPIARKPMLWALWTASAVWTAGSIALAMESGVAQKLPPLTLASLDGQTVDLQSFEGKPTVVNLWATWCPPCLREMPVLQKAQMTNSSVNFVFVNQGEEPRQVATWLFERQLALRNVVLDAPRKVGAALHQSAYPTTLFFDAKGTLVATRVGELSHATLSQKLDQLKLAETR